ncbi:MULTISPECIES: UDP-glucose 4-epimerase GalE [Cyanophyceae]|uniref:UDP-glucose 4-epimerase GalE n=1 Tax=Cyanophyceae TaxID=3028117 RepID=UPI00232D1003|nr:MULTISPECIES: UDP-glucose 4-epimerase GalE [Cyanophyceae]MDB9355815.1 UDP-glucose 4-epimerase GalE [Nodularia spumigena CS-587/03]MDB9323329.1 UDP-glucose 4-epimerase GalE [Nodularia spumigena CS-591/07A]MDB9330733.1 UDP-glucose 4-epimerase GalE [Nodularia spumigena CS-591/04]MDB9338391.1 UDP-glucose 4-epimerase GalE [Nodularia spumigena CS-589/07]MDB9348123.1 UDP-glucose 4-epimerase GalE [Nodularia spumigena CS-588/01]
MNKKVLVTGGAGYIGSHVVRKLGEAGYDIVVYDNCSTGSPQAVLYGELIVGDLKDSILLSQVFSQHEFTAVLHFAGSLNVPESVSRPLDYYANNTCNTLNLLRCCHKMGVKQIIFSSTASVYGEPEKIPVTEYTPTQPINPYGRSKLACEWLIRDYAQASDLRYVILRYFNVAGAEPGGRLGQMLRDASHLIRVSCDAALQRRTEVKIFGTDFPTPDGTAIRDYIHVEDLAAAHLDALTYLEQGKESQVLNCGYGQGYSVREVIERVKVISGVDFPVIDTERRPGDPACVIAGADKIGKLLGWQPKYNDLDKIVSSTLAWEMYQKGLMLN